MKKKKARTKAKLPPLFAVELVDPSIIYAVQLTNAAANQIYKMLKVLEATEPDKICGYSGTLEALGEKVTDVLDSLINFAASYAKSSV